MPGNRETLWLKEGVPTPFSKGIVTNDMAMRILRLYGDYISVEFPSPLNDDNYVLLCESHVGTLPLGDLTIRIAPKVPIDNLFGMLEYAYDLQSFRFLWGEGTSSDLQGFYEVLADVLARNASERARKGLYKSYVQRRDRCSFVRGRLLPLETAIGLQSGHADPVCRFGENTIDIEDNQILRWTLGMLARHVYDRQEVEGAVRDANRLFEGIVSRRPFESEACRGRTYGRLNQDYRRLHTLCGFFLDSCGPSVSGDDRESVPFVVDMKYLYQEFVAKWLIHHCEGQFRITPQYPRIYDIGRRTAFMIDILVSSPDLKPIMVLDTKYTKSEYPRAGEVHQMVSYSTMVGTEKAALVYPSAGSRELAFNIEDVQLRTMVFDVSGDIEWSGQRFLDQLAAFAASQ